MQRLADSHGARIGVALIGGALFETQNTGSQEFIFLWPHLMAVILLAWRVRAHLSRVRRCARSCWFWRLRRSCRMR